MTNKKVNYKAIYEYLEGYTKKMISPSQMAHDLGVERFYGATMTKLVREGYLEPTNMKGYYWVVNNK